VRKLIALPGVLLAILWGLAEATLFFVVPDVLLSFVAAYDARRALRHVLSALAGALIGGAAMFAWAAASPDAARAAVEKVPYVCPAMWTRVEQELRSDGALALFRGPIAGVPYKLYAVRAPAHVSFAAFLLMSIPARGARFILVWGFAALAGAGLRRRFPRQPLLCACVHIFSWTAFYAVYWSRI